MKKHFLIIASVMLLALQGAAQTFDVKTSKFDFDTLGLDKGWKNYGGYINSKGNYVVKFGKAYCNANVSKSISLDAWAGTQTTTTMATFNGVGYHFKEMEFDRDFNLMGSTPKDFSDMKSAIAYQKDLLGKKFQLTDGNINTGGGAAISAVGKAFSEGVPFIPTVNSDFINTIIVAPSTVASVGQVKNLVSTYVVSTDINGSLSKQGRASCSETPAYYLAKKEEAREEKGQTWVYACNSVYPGGGVVGFHTENVVPANGKANLIFKKYDETLKEIAKEQIDLDFRAQVNMYQVKNAKGDFDYILVVQGSERWGLKSQPKAKADDAEIIYMDGNTLKPLHRTPFKLKYSLWGEAVFTDENNNVYIMGNCAEDTKKFAGSFADNATNRPNFQIMKYKDGKIEWYSAYDQKGESGKTITVTGEGVKGKAGKEVIIYSPENDEDYEFLGNKLLLKGQEKVKFFPNGKLYLAIINLENGQLEKYFVKPESIVAKQDIILSKDKNVIYWATYDYKNYNDYDSNTNNLSGKKIKGAVIGELYISKIDLSSAATPQFSALGKEQWAVAYRNPVIQKVTDGDEIVFQGRTLTKKEKDSELIFIRVKK